MIRSRHQVVAPISRRHDRDVFQSSTTSWSSNIIELGMTDRSQRASGSPQASAYSRVYSSKSATWSYGGWRGSRRLAMNARVSGEVSSA